MGCFLVVFRESYGTIVVLPGQYVREDAMDKVLHALVLGRAIQKQLKRLLIPAVVFNQTP